MNEYRPAATLDAAVMADYFETMRQFLDTQGQVMAAFMGDAAAARVRAPVRTTARIAAPRLAEPIPHVAVAPVVPVAPVVTQAPTPAPAPRSNGVAHTPAPAAIVSAGSAKPEAKESAPSRANGAAKKPAADAAMDRATLTQRLLDIVEEKTGYPRDMVGLDQNLEADLGIDSIKRIEVVGAMLQSLPEKQRESLTAQRSRLNTQATLNGMLELLASNLEKANAA